MYGQCTKKGLGTINQEKTREIERFARIEILVRQVLFQKAWEINTVRKGNDSNCVGILSDQGKAATASNISEHVFTMKYVQSVLTYLQRPPEIFLSQPQGFSYTF